MKETHMRLSRSRLFVVLLLPTAFLLLGGISCARSTPDTGVLRSTDSGETWEQKSVIDDRKSLAGQNLLDITVSPHDGDRILAGGIESGVWISTNRAESWTQTNLKSPIIFDISFSPTDEDVVYAAGSRAGIGKIYKSEDGGSVWAEVYSSTHTSARVEALQVDWYDDTRVYAGTQDAVMLKTEDAGKNWEVIKEFDSKITDIEIGLDDSRIVFVGTESRGLQRSIDGGKKWEFVDQEPDEDNEVFSGSRKIFDVEVDPALPSIVYVASKYGLTRSKDSGQTWEDVPLLVKPGSVSRLHLALDPLSIRPIYVAIDASFYASEDFGETWSPQKVTGHRIRDIDIDPNDPQTLYMGIQQLD